MPAVRAAVKNLFGKEPHLGINPDEVVAQGAATQAGILQGDIKDVLLLDVTPLTLGIETLGSVSTPLIAKNTTIPTSKAQVFSTAADNQTQVEINVLQGEREMAADNKTLGRFILDGIPPAPRGVPQVEVTFDIDANGILNVSAKDKATGKEQKITITGSTGLSKEDAERMAKEAEAHAEEDKKKKEEIEIKNQADTLIYTTERSIKDAGDKMPVETKEDLEGKIKELQEAVIKGDKDEIKSKSESLSDALSKFGQTMYEKTGQQPNTDDQDQQEPEIKPEEEIASEEKDGSPRASGDAGRGEAGKADKGEAVEGEVVDDSGSQKN